MSNSKPNKIVRKHVGEIPLLMASVERLGVRRLFENFFPRHGNHRFSPELVLTLIVINIASSRQPLYELSEWVEQLDGRLFGFQTDLSRSEFSDDQFARALDKLYDADRASLMTQIVLKTIAVTQLRLDQVHNDSTSLKAFGDYSGQTKSGFALKHGHSKDHRPDLKQLVYTLTVSRDGAVPIHFKTYPGNTTDDQTHIETWSKLVTIIGKPDFLYVADCKVCTDKQLDFITTMKGRVVTVMPKTWKESKDFLKNLRLTTSPEAPLSVIRKRKLHVHPERYDIISSFDSDYMTIKRGFKIHWVHSTEKQRHTILRRERHLARAETALDDLILKLNRYHLKTRSDIEAAVENILKAHQCTGLISTTIREVTLKQRIQKGRGRPSQNTDYQEHTTTQYALSYGRSLDAIATIAKADGVFPLLSTDTSLSAKDVLNAYKFQPRLEKRFSQLKSVHKGAPLLFKKVERIEAIMFLFFVAMIVQACLERDVRNQMEAANILSLPLYPEGRPSRCPTTDKIFARFERMSTYRLEDEEGNIIGEFCDDLTEGQLQILKLLRMEQNSYWPKAA